MNLNGIRPMLWILLTIAFISSGCGVITSQAEQSTAVTNVASTANPGRNPLSGRRLNIGLVAPTVRDDSASTQSMVESLERVEQARKVEVSVTDSAAAPDQAAAAIRNYAESGYDIVLVHDHNLSSTLKEIAPEYPKVSFALNSASENLGAANLFTYSAAAEEGGYVLGTMAGLISKANIAVLGSTEDAESSSYARGFASGATKTNPNADVMINWTESDEDVALMTATANNLVARGVDVLTGISPAAVGAVGVAQTESVPWFGTQVDQTPLSTEVVVASQVYRWDTMLVEITTLVQDQTLGGQNFVINLKNGGLEIAQNKNFDLPLTAKNAANEAIAGIVDGSITALDE